MARFPGCNREAGPDERFGGPEEVAGVKVLGVCQCWQEGQKNDALPPSFWCRIGVVQTGQGSSRLPYTLKWIWK